MLVRDVLESKGRRIVTIDCEATVSEAIAKLVQNNIGSLPVVDGDEQADRNLQRTRRPPNHP